MCITKFSNWICRGKLIYAPSSAAFNRIIENVNLTFQDLRKVQNISKIWSQEISPALKGFLNQIEMSDTILNISKFINISVPQLDDLIHSILQNLTAQISTYAFLFLALGGKSKLIFHAYLIF